MGLQSDNVMGIPGLVGDTPCHTMPIFGWWCTCCRGRSWAVCVWFLIRILGFCCEFSPFWLVASPFCWLPWKSWQAPSPTTTKACLKIGYPKICWWIRSFSHQLAPFGGLSTIWNHQEQRKLMDDDYVPDIGAIFRASASKLYALLAAAFSENLLTGCWWFEGRIHVKSKMGGVCFFLPIMWV